MESYFDFCYRFFCFVFGFSREKILPSNEEFKAEFYRLKDVLTKTNSPIVFAHNDLLMGNIIYDEANNKVTFIDFEYAGYNYQAFDIGNHFAEFAGNDFLPNFFLWGVLGMGHFWGCKVICLEYFEGGTR